MTCRLMCYRNFEACRSLNGGFTASKLECDLARPGQFRSFECSKARWAGRRVTDRKPAPPNSPRCSSGRRLFLPLRVARMQGRCCTVCCPCLVTKRKFSIGNRRQRLRCADGMGRFQPVRLMRLGGRQDAIPQLCHECRSNVCLAPASGSVERNLARGATGATQRRRPSLISCISMQAGLRWSVPRLTEGRTSHDPRSGGDLGLRPMGPRRHH